MKKVGIITHYYGSKNYGGNLQAYALAKVINAYGGKAEQISFAKINEGNAMKLANPLKVAKSLLKKTINYCVEKKQKSQVEKIVNFNTNKIPHSLIVYNQNTISDAVELYDIFITGSDQVWNFKWYEEAYFLDFVPKHKKKISYAASIGMNNFTTEQSTIVKEHLRDFGAISVRESESIQLIDELTECEVVSSLDPTLLLSRNEWEQLSEIRKVHEEYVFCYFLGEDNVSRRLAKSYAMKNKLKLITIPYIFGAFRKCDFSYADINIYDAGVEDFLSLIRYATCVFTDSFHATVFSGIFEREYFVFERLGANGMESRLLTLTQLYEAEERFCNSTNRCRIEYLEGCETIDYSRELKRLDKKKRESIEYLEKHIRGF